MSERWLDRERFSVWGLGRSGLAAANLLARHGKKVHASDIRDAAELNQAEKKLHRDVEFTAGANVIGDAQVVVTSPGLRPGLKVFKEARRREIDVISEVELAREVSPSRWVGITGTDGKTTTTSLVGAMLEASGYECTVAGNIGTALCDVVEDFGSEAVVVAELSANQLWSCHHLDVDVAAITNIAEDHLDYFDDFSEYPEAKYRLIRLQAPGACAVLPAGDPVILEALKDEGPRQWTLFGAGEESSESTTPIVYFDERGRGRYRFDGEQGTWLDDFSQVALLGRHNQLNAACAAAIARSIGADWEGIREGLLGFSALPHRMEPVALIDGIRYVDDSKATNAHASLAGLEGIDDELIVIAGGRDKGLDLEKWGATVAEKARLVVVIGEISDRMAALLQRHGGTVATAATLEEAVDRAHHTARPGSTVVLSPACSSYDMFSSYKERGRRFQTALKNLTPKG